MKGNFNDDERISSKDAEKKTFGSNSGIFLIKYPDLSPFACLLIGVTQEAEGTILHKEKKRKRNN